MSRIIVHPHLGVLIAILKSDGCLHFIDYFFVKKHAIVFFGGKPLNVFCRGEPTVDGKKQ